MSSKPTDVRLRMPARSQMARQVASADDLVSAGHPVRLIWEVTGRLDLAAFYAPVKARVGEVGRNATDPRLLVALWLYAVTRGVGSARELARLCVESDPYR
ncbi:MAG: IS5/IS1182 family transposase, partial [Tepidisphaeraceae bacterium]